MSVLESLGGLVKMPLFLVTLGVGYELPVKVVEYYLEELTDP